MCARNVGSWPWHNRVFGSASTDSENRERPKKFGTLTPCRKMVM